MDIIQTIDALASFRFPCSSLISFALEITPSQFVRKEGLVFNSSPSENSSSVELFGSEVSRSSFERLFDGF
jgi:hypothetical protein